MINYENIKAEDYFTEGFIASEPSPMVLTFSSGSFTKVNIRQEETTKQIINEEGQIVNKIVFETVEEPEVTNYGAFQFAVEADNEFPVVYDVFLLEAENRIHIDRTEIGSDTMCIYAGEEPLMHTLCSFLVQPGTTSLEYVNINVRNVVRQKEA